MSADASSWQHLPAPELREPLQFEGAFTRAEARQLLRGLVPEAMEDKWFIYYADGWLRFHRSWTGAFIYALQIEWTVQGVRVGDSWASRDPAQYHGDSPTYERLLVRFLIDALLLGRPDAVFPLPNDLPQQHPGLLQHAVVGRAYPESSAPADGQGQCGAALLGE